MPEAIPSKNHGGNIISVAKEIAESWPELRGNLQQRQTTSSGLDEASTADLQKFDDLISLLVTLTTEPKASELQTESAVYENSTLPLQRFLQKEDEWQAPVQRDSVYAAPVLEAEAKVQNWNNERSGSPSASSLSLVADSALSTAASDDTIIIDTSTIQNSQARRRKLDEPTLSNLNEKLCRIVTSGQVTKNVIARATDLIDAGADVNARDVWCDGTVYDTTWSNYQLQKGWLRATVLYAAVAVRADCDVIRLLLNKGADINGRGGFNGTPLLDIVQSDEKDIARLLLNRGADINAKPSAFGLTAFLLAAEYGTIGMVELLLERGAQVMGASDSQKRTALHFAAQKDHIGMVKLLLDRGAVIDAQSRDKGETPLAGALKMGHKSAVRTLLARGADVNLLPPVLETYAQSPKRGHLIDMLKEYGAEYTCSTPEVPRAPPKRIQTFELVRHGHGKPTSPDAIASTEDKEFPEDDQNVHTYESKDAKSQADENVDPEPSKQREETGSVISYQTNSTAKTETKKRRKFWSRFSSQTTLHDNS